MSNENKNELRAELLGIHSTNPFIDHNSSPRSTMYSGHFAQRLVTENMEEKIFQTGVDMEFGKHTFSVKMPENGRVIKIIKKYPEGVGRDSLNHNPVTIVIYENEVTKEVDYFSIPYYASFHQFFGYRYVLKDKANLLRPGAYIPKDTVFADSPGVADNGNYMYGVNLNTAFMSIPSISEDGVMISRKALDKLKFRIYETRVVEFGASQFPLNLYGSATQYKPFPDIGECLREDGILMMLRTYDDVLMPVEMSIYDTTEPDFVFDKAIYVRGGGGRIVDIKVISNNNPIKQMPEGFSEQADKYIRALNAYYQEIIDTEAQLRYERKRKYGDSKLKLSHRFHKLLVESLAMTNHNANKLKQTLNLLYRRVPIDECRIEFTIEYIITPSIGYKITDTAGGKGVICKIEEEENMPIDENGNRAEIVLGGESTANRMNLGRLYEHYFNSASRDLRLRIMNMVGIHGPTCPDSVACLDPQVFDSAFNTLMDFYRIVSPGHHDYFAANLTLEDKHTHLAEIINDKIYVYYPIGNQIDPVAAVQAIEKLYPPVYGPVKYTGDSGNSITTKENVRIAPMYMMLLDKIADDWSSVSSGKLQHFGVLTPPTKSEKFSAPYRNSPVRTIGETEGRIFVGYCGREAVAEMMDRSNNPITQRNIIWNILNSPKPSNIDHVVDREDIKLGSSRPLQLVSHILGTAGIRAVYESEDKENKLANQG